MIGINQSYSSKIDPKDGRRALLELLLVLLSIVLGLFVGLWLTANTTYSELDMAFPFIVGLSVLYVLRDVVRSYSVRRGVLSLLALGFTIGLVHVLFRTYIMW